MTLSCFVLLAAALVSGSACAGSYNVTRTDDPAPDGCSPNDCSLREAVIDANQTPALDTIILEPGTYLIDLVGGNDFSEETGDLDISSDMEFIGAPSVIDAQNLGRIMDITGSADVTLRHLTLQNANTSLDTNGSLNGGAIEANGDSLRLFDTTFLNNRTQALGGALRLFDSALVEIDGCVFSGNRADNGAAIHASVGITVRNTVFESNRSDVGSLGSGPVAYLTGTTSDSVFDRVRFQDNFANGTGGSVYFSGRQLAIDVLVATGNEAGGNGGVLFVPGTAHAKVVRLTNARFNGNMAENGGAITTSDDDDLIDLNNIGFVDNHATSGNGGALYATGGQITLANDTFSANQASSNGGAVYVSGGDAHIFHATFTGNSASAGDALYVLGTSVITAIDLGNNVIEGGCQIANSETVTSSGGNVEGPGSSCELGAASDLVSQTSQQIGLGQLQNNYHATPTHELAPGSVARGRGDPAICADVAVDQLFEPRDTCNSGAVESELIFKDGVEISRFEI